MYKIFVLEFGEKKSIFLKDLQEYCHLHIFPKSEDNSLFMWFKQHLHWKAYPLICGDIFLSMTVQKRDGREIGFSQSFSNKVKLLLIKNEKW